MSESYLRNMLQTLEIELVEGVSDVNCFVIKYDEEDMFKMAHLEANVVDRSSLPQLSVQVIDLLFGYYDDNISYSFMVDNPLLRMEVDLLKAMDLEEDVLSEESIRDWFYEVLSDLVVLHYDRQVILRTLEDNATLWVENLFLNRDTEDVDLMREILRGLSLYALYDRKGKIPCGDFVGSFVFNQQFPAGSFFERQYDDSGPIAAKHGLAHLGVMNNYVDFSDPTKWDCYGKFTLPRIPGDGKCFIYSLNILLAYDDDSQRTIIQNSFLMNE